VTLWVFMALAVGVLALLFFLGLGHSRLGFWGFLLTFLLLFAATGVGNASTFQMIPVIFRIDRERAYAEREGTPVSPEIVHREAERETAAVIGFTSAIAAYGAFFIPKSFGSSIALSGGPEAALYGFLLFYVLCIVVTWMEYSGQNAEIRC
jgi:MFS transporter, NNP family, nitrate/nitrite transporter